MMTYFSYGSNMSVPRLGARIRGFHRLGVCRLERHDLRFHKIGHDGSAKCDAFYTGQEEDFVLGVLYRIDPHDKAVLDRFEGLGCGYEVTDVQLLSAIDEQVAFTYVATHISDDLAPFSWYLRHVIEGAEAAALPAAYIDRIRRTECLKDPDEEREGQELSIYEG